MVVLIFFSVSKIGLRCLMVLVVLSVLFCAEAQDLKLGFYNKSCPKAERIIKEFVGEHIPNAPSLASPLLRMHFHDCFVRGCDASILINSTSTNQTEKTSSLNQSLRGFDFIDRVKALVEAEWPGVVSCADIIALTARDAIEIIGGPFWKVPTGRRDGLISNDSEANDEIPAPNFNITSLETSFANKGLNMTDLVFLLGAHTIGMTRCSSFSNRLYNFTGNGDHDPSLDPYYVANLKAKKCKSPNDTTTNVEMDPGSFKTFDLGYYKNVLKRRGLFQSDAALITDISTNSLIVNLVSGPLEIFFEGFSRAMEKMGRIGVKKTGSEGEIRKNCAVVNS